MSDSISVQLFNDGETVMETVAHGLQTQVLIRLEPNEEGGTEAIIRATGPKDARDLEETFTVIAQAMSEVAEQEEADE